MGKRNNFPRPAGWQIHQTCEVLLQLDDSLYCLSVDARGAIYRPASVMQKFCRGDFHQRGHQRGTTWPFVEAISRSLCLAVYRFVYRSVKLFLSVYLCVCLSTFFSIFSFFFSCSFSSPPTLPTWLCVSLFLSKCMRFLPINRGFLKRSIYMLFYLHTNFLDPKQTKLSVINTKRNEEADRIVNRQYHILATIIISKFQGL